MYNTHFSPIRCFFSVKRAYNTVSGVARSPTLLALPLARSRDSPRVLVPQVAALLLFSSHYYLTSRTSMTEIEDQSDFPSLLDFASKEAVSEGHDMTFCLP